MTDLAAYAPIITFLSPVVKDVPALYPKIVLSVASVPEKLSPAFVPPTVFLCASDSTPPTLLPSDNLNALAVTIPVNVACPVAT